MRGQFQTQPTRPTPALTLTPSPTVTPAPTAAPTPTPSPSPTPSLTPTPSPTPAVVWYRDIGKWKDLVTILALVTGGVWAYFKYFKGRIFKPRLELKVLGKVVSKDNVNLLRVSMEIKNIGASVVYFDHALTQLLIYRSIRLTTPSKADTAFWHEQDPACIRAFVEHNWVEPDETITDTQLIELPDTKNVAYKIVLKVGSCSPSIKERWRRWRKHRKEGSRWRSNTIASEKDNGDGEDSVWIGGTD